LFISKHDSQAPLGDELGAVVTGARVDDLLVAVANGRHVDGGTAEALAVGATDGGGFGVFTEARAYAIPSPRVNAVVVHDDGGNLNGAD